MNCSLYLVLQGELPLSDLIFLTAFPLHAYHSDFFLKSTSVFGLHRYKNFDVITSYLFADSKENHKAHVPYGWIIGSLGIGLAVIIVCVVVFLSLRSSSCFTEPRGNRGKDHDEKSPHKFHILRNPSFLCGSGRYICCKPGDWRQTNGEPSSHQINIPKGTALSVASVAFPLDYP